MSSSRPLPRRPRPWHHATLPLRRLARRIADGVPPQQAAGIEGIDETQAKELIGEANFSELVQSYHELLALEPEERLQRLAKRALFVLEDEIDEMRSGAAAAWLLYELGHGRNPGLTLAKAVARACAPPPLRPAATVTTTSPAPAKAVPVRPPAPPLTGEKLVAARMAAVRRRLAARLLAEAARTARGAGLSGASTGGTTAAGPAASGAHLAAGAAATGPQPRRPACTTAAVERPARRLKRRLKGGRSPGTPASIASPAPSAGRSRPCGAPHKKPEKKRAGWPLGP